MTIHRLVLLLLLLPIVCIGAVFWFLLPGSVGGIAYSPGEISRRAQLTSDYWQGRQVTIAGYVLTRCTAGDCAGGVAVGDRAGTERAAVRILPQPESGWHRLLRNALPGLAAPFPEGAVAGSRVTITGTIRRLPNGRQSLVLAPNSL